MKQTHIISRLANLSLFAVLLVLAGFSIWAAILNQQATSNVELSTRESDLYRRIVYTLSTEESIQYEYALRPSTSLQNEHLATANTLIALLQELQRVGDPDDTNLARQILAEQTRYLIASSRYFAAIDAHDLTRASALHYQDIDPIFDQIAQQMRMKADQEQVLAAHDLVSLSQVQHIIFVTTPTIFVIGLLLVTALWWMITSYRRKVDQSLRAEMIRLEQQVITDPLTNLGNHRAYQERLTRAVEDAAHEGDRLVLALLNIDEFKAFNDEQGHQCGDKVLLAFADLLREARLSNALFRLGSDDFALIVSRAHVGDTNLALERFREDVERCPLDITVSIGVANTASGELNRESLHARAVAALREAKRRGRNRMLTFDEIEESVSIVSSAKVKAIRRLLSERKITVVFQPIWNLATGTVLAFEALTRPAADYGFSGPQEMFDIAEQIGRAHELDVICVQAILARAAELPTDAMLFLNLTPQTLVHDLLTGAVLLEAVVTAGLTPSRLALEITERSLVVLGEIIQKVKFLRLMGFQVAIDDAGAGNAGLEMLSQLSVDFVKIDRAVVSRALTDQAAYSVLAGIATIARESHLSIIAEGIENPEMLVMVKQLNVQCVQGYLLGRPSETILDTTALQGLSPLAQIA